MAINNTIHKIEIAAKQRKYYGKRLTIDRTTTTIDTILTTVDKTAVTVNL